MSDAPKLGTDPACAAIEIKTFGFRNGMPDPVQKVYHTGLTKRELFAAMAMQGLTAGLGWTDGRIFGSDELAADAVCVADSLLRALAK